MAFRTATMPHCAARMRRVARMMRLQPASAPLDAPMSGLDAPTPAKILATNVTCDACVAVPSHIPRTTITCSVAEQNAPRPHYPHRRSIFQIALRSHHLDENLISLLLAEREKHLRWLGVPDTAGTNLGLVKPPRSRRSLPARPARSGSRTAAAGPARGTHETRPLDRGVPVHVVAARCGHD